MIHQFRSGFQRWSKVKCRDFFAIFYFSLLETGVSEVERLQNLDDLHVLGNVDQVEDDFNIVDHTVLASNSFTL